MTPTEFRDARHALGLTLSRMAAALTDVDHLADKPEAIAARTIRYWETTGPNGRDIPHPVVVLVKAWLHGALTPPAAK